MYSKKIYAVLSENFDFLINITFSDSEGVQQVSCCGDCLFIWDQSSQGDDDHINVEVNDVDKYDDDEYVGYAYDDDKYDDKQGVTQSTTARTKVTQVRKIRTRWSFLPRWSVNLY